MNHRQTPKALAGIALFPFLAVLACAAGGLIVLLVVVARTGESPAAVDSSAASDARQQLEIEREDLQWRIGHLRGARDKTAQQLADERSDVSHVEDHIRRLRGQLAEVKRSIDDFDRLRGAKIENVPLARAQLEDLRRQIRETSAEIESTRHGQPQASKAPIKSRRRPVFIECRADGLAFEPEGIELVEADFNGPLAADNPLAAGLRAAREYLVKNSGSAAEPYPVLLVRPDGVLSFYAAREAMRSWGSDFGYELVDAGWKADSKPPDAGLAAAVSQAVEDARRRQDALAMTARRMARARQRMLYCGSSDHVSVLGGAGENAAGVSSNTVGHVSMTGTRTASRWDEQEPPTAEEIHTPKRSLASFRGKGWLLPPGHENALAIERTIVLRCYRDQLVVVHEPGDGRPSQIIPLGFRTQDSIDPLIAAIGQRLDSWGRPGIGKYWRPTLVVEVAPDATGRWADLHELLANGGLDLQQANPTVPAGAPQD